MLSFLAGVLGAAFMHAGWTMKTDSMLDFVLLGSGFCLVLKAFKDFLYGLAHFLESIDPSS